MCNASQFNRISKWLETKGSIKPGTHVGNTLALKKWLDSIKSGNALTSSLEYQLTVHIVFWKKNNDSHDWDIPPQCQNRLVQDFALAFT